MLERRIARLARARPLRVLRRLRPEIEAFGRDEAAFHSSHFVELPIAGYDFSLMRHFLFDHAESLRFEMLTHSSYEPLAALARKIKGELKYHVLHADLWVTKLGHGTEESHARMQSALNEAMPYALGLFETTPTEEQLIADGVFAGEKALQAKWLEVITPILEKAGLVIPDVSTLTPVYGGRNGYHSEHLQPLITEMSEVCRLDPTATW